MINRALLEEAFGAANRRKSPPVNKTLLVGAALVSGVLLAWVLIKGTKGVAESMAKGAVGMAEGTITGTVIGVGEAVGVPQTNAEKCQAAKAAGSKWEASKYCPMGEFVGFLFE